jgi:hypothetical protein
MGNSDNELMVNADSYYIIPLESSMFGVCYDDDDDNIILTTTPDDYMSVDRDEAIDIILTVLKKLL